jgi:hypothetical protein
VSREGYYLSEYVFKIGKNCLLPPQTGEKNQQKLVYLTSNANKITLNQHFFNIFIYLDSLNVLVDDY